MAGKQLIFIPVLLLLCQMFYRVATQQCTEAEYSKSGMMLRRHIFKKITGVSLSGMCLLDCYQDVRCQSFNYVISQYMCELNNRTKEARPEDYVPDPDRLYFRRDMNRVPIGSIPELPAETCKEIKLSEGGQAVSGKYWFYSIIPGKTVLAHCDMKNEVAKGSCAEIKSSEGGKAVSGKYWLKPKDSNMFPVYCDMTSDNQGWTLIARFSNNDTKHWMNDSGYWWYDKTEAAGKTTDPLNNTDMISPAFWLTSGNKFKITRSDDSLHTPLLHITGNCLGGQNFRSKVTSFGDFRNGTVWANDQCLGSCTVQYGGQYQSTDGFEQAACSGDIQGDQAIGFWCDWSGGDGAVLMIGGGGASCSRADHGIGITEANEASFVDSGTDEMDFGSEANAGSGTTDYSLNLWVI